MYVYCHVSKYVNLYVSVNVSLFMCIELVCRLFSHIQLNRNKTNCRPISLDQAYNLQDVQETYFTIGLEIIKHHNV